MQSLPLRAASCYPYFEENLRQLELLTQGLLSAADTCELPNSALRFEVITWVLDLAHSQHFSVHCGQLACVYFDLFSRRWPSSRLAVMRVVACTCLLLASKFIEVSALTPDWVSEVCGREAGAENVKLMELAILTELDFHLDQPTAAEVINLTLCMSAPGHDFSKLIKESLAYASVCYHHVKLLAYGPIAIGLAGVCSALEQYSLLEFRDQWLDMVLDKTSVQRERVLELSSRIRAQLRDLYSSDTETECSTPDLERTLSV